VVPSWKKKTIKARSYKRESDDTFPMSMIDRLDLDNAIKPLYTRPVQPISEELWMEVDKLIEAATQRLVQDCF
jgi:hypothetical protein